MSKKQFQKISRQSNSDKAIPTKFPLLWTESYWKNQQHIQVYRWELVLNNNMNEYIVY